MQRLFPWLVLPLLAGVGSGCSERDERLVRVSLMSEAVTLAPASSGKPSLPAELRSATAEGLVGFDAQGRVVPALADRWIVTDDGQSYIFRLRNGNWPDGKPLSAESAASALRHALRGLRGSALALDLAPVAEVRPMAARVVEMRLSSPVPDLLALLAQPELGLLRQGKGSGPMSLELMGGIHRLRPLAPESLGLTRQEDWNERTRDIHLRLEPAEKAVARFDAGYSDVVLGGRADTLPLVKTAGISRGTVRLDPVIGLFGMIVLNDQGFLATPRNREALAMAIDRDSLVAGFNVAGWSPTTSLVPAGLEADPGALGERWAELPLAERQRIAAGRVASWREGGEQPRPLRIAVPATPGGSLIFDRLRLDFQAIGLTVLRVGEAAAADLRLLDIVGRYARSVWFLNQLSCAARRAVCSIEADDLLARARAATDVQARADLLAEAEARITEANGFIPFARPLRWSLVRADVTGFAINPWANHPLLPLALAPS